MKDKYKHLTPNIFIILALFFTINITSQPLKAQVTIGSSEEPNKGALLDLKEDGNKGVNATRGLMLPRVELINLQSMQPIFEDDELTDELQKSHIGLTLFNTTINYPLGLCKGVYVWTSSLEWQRLPEPCCLGLTGIEVANTVLNYMEGNDVEFSADITPKEATTPISYEWYIGNTLIEKSQNNSITIPVKREYDGKEISVKASNKCTNSQVISEGKTLVIDSNCDPVTSVIIDGADRLLTDGEVAVFTANTTPIDPTSPVTFKWYLDNELVYEDIDDNGVEADIIYAYNGKSLKVVVSSCDDQIVESPSQILNVCKPVVNLDITNNLQREVFSFASNYEVTFTPALTPSDPSGNITYQWYIDGQLVSSSESLKRSFPKITEGGNEEYELKLIVSNECGSATSIKTIYIHDCVEMSDDKRISLEGGGEGNSTAGRSEWTFIINDLLGYTSQQLEEMGVSIQWYYTNDGPIGPYTYTPIPQANTPKFTINLADENSPFRYGANFFGFVVKGSKKVFDCPMIGDKSNGVFMFSTQDGKVKTPRFVDENTSGLTSYNRRFINEWINNFSIEE